MVNRAHPPNSYTPGFKPYKLPAKVEINQSISLYSFNLGEQNVFKIELIFSSGSASSDNPVLASFCVSMLREGSIKKTASEINELIDYYGAFIDFKAGLDSTSISIYGQSGFLPELISILREMVSIPSFPEKMILKHKEKLIQRLKISHRKTSYWGPRILRQLMFGATSSYGKLINQDDIEKVSRNDLVTYHQNVLLPSLQHIIVAGTYNDNETIKLISDSFSEFGGKEPSSFNPSLKFNNPGISEKRLEGTTQATIALGKKIQSISEPVYPETGLLIKVLGGYFGSRLMKKLREDEGLTYGIHAFNMHLGGGSYLQISADVESKSIDKSIELIFREIETLRKEYIPEEELNTVKNYMLGEYINDSNSVFDFAELHKKILLYNLSDSYYKSFYDHIAGIQSDNILQRANTVLKQSEFSIAKVS